MWKIHSILIQNIFLLNTYVSKINKLLSASGDVNKLRKVFGLRRVAGKEGGGRSIKSGINRFRLTNRATFFSVLFSFH